MQGSGRWRIDVHQGLGAFSGFVFCSGDRGQGATSITVTGMRHPLTATSEATPQQLRDAMATFATGVTIITTRDAEGNPVGLTVNSFSSVSLTPPLVMWCLGNGSSCRAGFDHHPFFAVHVLAADQQALAMQFAGAPAQRFEGVALDTNARGLPILPGCLAVIECERYQTLEGGDHQIYMGHVLATHQVNAGPALVYHQRRFSHT